MVTLPSLASDVLAADELNPLIPHPVEILMALGVLVVLLALVTVAVVLFVRRRPASRPDSRQELSPRSPGV